MFELYRENNENFQNTLSIFNKIVDKLKQEGVVNIKNIEHLETPNTKENIITVLENIVKERSIIQEVVAGILNIPSFSAIDLSFDFSQVIIEKDFVIHDGVLYLINPFIYYENILKKNIDEFNPNEILFSQIGIISLDKIERLVQKKEEFDRKNNSLNILEMEKLVQNILIQTHLEKPEEIQVYKKNNDVVINFKKNGFVKSTDLNIESFSNAEDFIIFFKDKFKNKVFLYNFNNGHKYKFILTEEEESNQLLVINCFDMSLKTNTIENLNLKNSDIENFKKSLESSSGIIFVSSNSSNKNDLICSVIEYIKRTRKNKNILSIEEIIKQEIEQVYQIERKDKHLNFFNNQCVSSDIICISDISTKEDMNFIINQSLSGKLVIAGVSANNSISALAKIISINENTTLLADNLLNIIHTCLVPALCQRCSIDYNFSKDKFYQNLYFLDNSPKSKDIIAGPNEDGCFDCNNGRKGYIKLNELLINDKILLGFIKNGLDINKLKIEKRSSSWRNIYVSSLDFLKSKQLSSKDIINSIGFYKIH